MHAAENPTLRYVLAGCKKSPVLANFPKNQATNVHLLRSEFSQVACALFCGCYWQTENVDNNLERLLVSVVTIDHETCAASH